MLLPAPSSPEILGARTITLWKDYWDMNGLTSFAPPAWLEGLAAADMSWMFDATGLI